MSKVNRRIIVITGNGKGKTTSAIGSAVRAMGRGFRVFFYQFIKSMDREYGEHIFFKDRELDIVRLGCGCRKDFKYDEKDIEAAKNGLMRIESDITSNIVSDKGSLVVLDEVSYPIIWKWFDVKEITGLMDKFSDTNFILTGRDMPKEIIDKADTVSSVEEIKHAYQEGVQAQKGIDF